MQYTNKPMRRVQRMHVLRTLIANGAISVSGLQMPGPTRHDDPSYARRGTRAAGKSYGKMRKTELLVNSIERLKKSLNENPE